MIYHATFQHGLLEGPGRYPRPSLAFGAGDYPRCIGLGENSSDFHFGRRRRRGGASSRVFLDAYGLFKPHRAHIDSLDLAVTAAARFHLCDATMCTEPLHAADLQNPCRRICKKEAGRPEN